MVVLTEDGIVPTHWIIAGVVKTYPGADGVVRVMDLKTVKGVYRRPVHKIARLLELDN